MNGQTPVRVGVVGLGWFGRTHLDAWASVRGATVVGVCDRDPDALRGDINHAQQDFHSDAGGGQVSTTAPAVAQHASLDALLDSGIDLLDVVVTEDQHEACVRTALEAGVDVVVEKPLALDATAATELIRTADRLGRHIYVGQVLRFDPRHVALAELVRGSELRHLSLTRNFQTSAHGVYGRTHPVLNAAVHDIDLAVWLVGRAPDRVAAYASHFLERIHPDVVDLVLEWEGGVRAVVQNSWHLPPTCPFGFTFDCTVQAVDGTYIVRSEPVVQAWSAEGVTSPELFFWPRYAGARRGALVEQLQHFADCAAGHRPSHRVPLTDVVAVMNTCQAAMEALSTGQSQPVPKPSFAPRPEEARL